MLTFSLTMPQPIRRAAVAGTWYAGRPDVLAQDIDRCLGQVPHAVDGDIVGLVVPHAGLMYSGSVAAHAYKAVAGRAYDVAVLIGPSHYVGFEGVAIQRTGSFETPLGRVVISEVDAEAIAAASPAVHDRAAAHLREHSLEMQLPFLQRVLPETPIVPLVMGHQTPATISRLADAIVEALPTRRALLVASSDLSHFHRAADAARLDAVVVDAINRFDPETLGRALAKFPDHACGGGPIVTVMLAARGMGAADARVMKYADSGDVSGDKSSVVGYLAAVLGTLSASRGGEAVPR
ncbi:MAG: AmmeMemoRadiSam system protein B [Acidobacteria bacterium]|nr:AmmeMemoRadiSam system protein B [Acidobacteriota bacterium]